MKIKSAAQSFGEIATVRIELKDTDPLIWREVEAPTSMTLKVLHDIVQITIGWMNYHLWAFVINGQTYGPTMLEAWGDEPHKDAAKVRLRDVLTPGVTTIDYTYDFGDSWEHRILVSSVRQGEAGVRYPRYMGGERNGPPEDCGGIPGFYDFLEARDDPDHPNHADAKDWFAEFDPDEIETFPIEVALDRLAARRNAAAVRISKLKRP